MNDPIIERETVDMIPKTVTAGGFLEWKRGQVCLRKADEIVRLSSGDVLIVRTWLPPGDRPYDVRLYGKPRSNTIEQRGK